MTYSPGTANALRGAAWIVNTRPAGSGEDGLSRLEHLTALLDTHPYYTANPPTPADVEGVRITRARIAGLWDVDRAGAVELVNAMLRVGRATPQLVMHDQCGWNLWASAEDQSLATRILVETAMAFAEVIRLDQYERVRRCAADGCVAVYVDCSKNGSRRYCDTGNCGNRMNVTAYRRRKARGGR